ncbi:hypothetical protein LZ30DRAFT_422064 [Colletotrichum cereale]|nr:hypothetical protein LZ30DRAFT_422064 [Colletotrichum cereale]
MMVGTFRRRLAGLHMPQLFFRFFLSLVCGAGLLASVLGICFLRPLSLPRAVNGRIIDGSRRGRHELIGFVTRMDLNTPHTQKRPYF